MVMPTNSHEAHEAYKSLKEQHADTHAAMRGVLAGKHTLSANEADAFDRLEAKSDRIEADMRALAERHPSVVTGERGIPEAAQPSWSSVSFDDEGVHPVDASTGERGSLVEWAAERRMGGSNWGVQHAAEFSLGKYLRGALTGQWRDADLERRALAEGTDSAGGFLVPTVLASSVIDRLKPRTRVIEAGAQVIGLDSDTLDLPRVSTGVTAGWRAENSAIAESDPAFDRVQLRPRSLAVMTRLSRELFEDLPDAGLQAIENELTSALAVELDRAALLGSGSSNQPTGVLNQSGVTTRTNGANGTAVTWAIPADAVAQLRAANVEPTGFIWAPRTTASLTALVDTSGQPLRAPESLAALPAYDTTGVPVDVTVGSSNACSYVFAADWRQLVIGVRPSLRVEVLRDQSRFIDTGQIAIVAHLRADIGVLRPAAFVIETGVKA